MNRRCLHSPPASDINDNAFLVVLGLPSAFLTIHVGTCNINSVALAVGQQFLVNPVLPTGQLVPSAARCVVAAIWCEFCSSSGRIRLFSCLASFTASVGLDSVHSWASVKKYSSCKTHAVIAVMPLPFLLDFCWT